MVGRTLKPNNANGGECSAAAAVGENDGEVAIASNGHRQPANNLQPSTSSIPNSHPKSTSPLHHHRILYMSAIAIDLLPFAAALHPPSLWMVRSVFCPSLHSSYLFHPSIYYMQAIILSCPPPFSPKHFAFTASSHPIFWSWTAALI
jgi:hypothetical protein